MLTARSSATHSPARPLYVDLDGTVVASNLLWETLLLAVTSRPLTMLLLPLWLLRGRAYLKAQLAALATPDPAQLPYRPEVLRYLEERARTGVEIVLATAADRRAATRVAAHVGLFSAVLSSDGQQNLKGAAKLEAIRRHAGGRAFDYIGDSFADLAVWQGAVRAVLVAPAPALLRRAQREHASVELLGERTGRGWAVVGALRPYQWAKNLLLFVPLVLAHRLTDVTSLGHAVLAFLAFSLCASAVYICNDLLDLAADREHPRKRTRAFASGAVPIPVGLTLIPILLVGAFGLSLGVLPAEFTGALTVYLGTTTAYSFSLKRVAILDVLILASVYTLRVIAGALAISVAISPWLPAFSMFIFMSLALVKRYSELRLTRGLPAERLNGREYTVGDIELLASIGPASGYLAVLVLALYVNSREVAALYTRPAALWLVGPLLLYWITRIWFLAHRGQMHDDPLLFTLTDRSSYVVAGLLAGIMLVAAL